LFAKKQGNTSSSIEDIVEGKFYEWKEFRLAVLLIVTIYSEVLF